MALTLDLSLQDRILDAARRAAPRPAAGILVGRREPVRRVVEMVELTGDHPLGAPSLVTPAEFVRVEGAARERGLEIVGTWHSHPGGRAGPTDLDREDALPGMVHIYVAVDPDGGRVTARAFELDGSEETLVEVEVDLSAW